jgi:hypothetical protein
MQHGLNLSDWLGFASLGLGVVGFASRSRSS